MILTPFVAAWQTLTPFAQGLVALWLIEMVSVPIVTWLWGDRAQLQGIRLGVLLQAGAVVTATTPHWGGFHALTIVLGVAVLAWSFEFIGSHTGIPFGAYHYTDRLRPQLGGVPVIIPLAWLMMLPPAWAVGEAVTQIVSPIDGNRLVFVLASALAFTAWDLFLDPQMVKWGLWIWDRPTAPGYFGIPWTNYAGWFVCAAVLTAILAPARLPRTPLVAIYGLTWFLETVGQIAFWQLPGPGIVGSLGMGLFLIGALVAS